MVLNPSAVPIRVGGKAKGRQSIEAEGSRATNNQHAQKGAKNVHDRVDVYRKQGKMNMTLTEYFKDEPRGAKAEMAEYLKITPTWLSQLMKGERRASAALCMKIEKATCGMVKRKDLRPDLFGTVKKRL